MSDRSSALTVVVIEDGEPGEDVQPIRLVFIVHAHADAPIATRECKQIAQTLRLMYNAEELTREIDLVRAYDAMKELMTDE